MLGAKEALPIPAALETWEADSLGVTEKAGVGGIEIAQRTLQGLGVDFRKPLMFRLQLALHQVRQIHIAKCFLTFLICGYLQVECPVIDKTAAAEGLGKQNLLLVCRIYSIFIGT